jgi:hypothetical protein
LFIPLRLVAKEVGQGIAEVQDRFVWSSSTQDQVALGNINALRDEVSACGNEEYSVIGLLNCLEQCAGVVGRPITFGLKISF